MTSACMTCGGTWRARSTGTGFSLAVDELVLENILQAVRAQMQQDADEEPKKQDATAQANLAIARMTQARSKGDQTESAPTDDVTRKR